MRHLGLFEGIGGFSLAAHWMGWTTDIWVEINEDCQTVLKDKFHGVDGFADIKSFNGNELTGTIDIITGGFPCQTFSLAGKGALDLSLWKEMLRVICEVKPRWVVAENVFGILARKKGMALETVCADLESKGYTVFPPIIIPACSKGAPHRRDRVWIIAHSNANRIEWKHRKNRRQESQSEVKENKWQWIRNEFSRNAEPESIADPPTQGLQKRIQRGEYCFEKQNGPFQRREHSRIYSKDDWAKFPTVSPISTRNDGLPGKLDRRDARLRSKSIKASGNAIVPQVAFEIFKAIEATERAISS